MDFGSFTDLKYLKTESSTTNMPKKAANVKNLLKQALKWVLIGSLITLLFVIKQTQVLAVIAVMAVISFMMGLSTNVLQKSNIGLSFTKLMIMILMYWYGLKAAIFAAPLIQMTEWVGQNYYKPSMVFIIPNMMLMPLYGFWILHYDIAWSGMVLLTIANIIEVFGSMFIAKNPVKIWMYYITNTLFNFPIFLYIAPLLVG